MKQPDPNPGHPGTATPCPVEGCFRESCDWQWDGPPFCAQHRAEWAADRERAIAAAEWEHWANLYAYDTPGGLTVSTWPDNFKVPVRPTREALEVSNQKVWAEEARLRAERAKARVEAEATRAKVAAYPEVKP